MLGPLKCHVGLTHREEVVSARIDGARPGMICSVNRSPCSAHLYSRKFARKRRNLHCDLGLLVAVENRWRRRCMAAVLSLFIYWVYLDVPYIGLHVKYVDNSHCDAHELLASISLVPSQFSNVIHFSSRFYKNARMTTQCGESWSAELWRR